MKFQAHNKKVEALQAIRNGASCSWDPWGLGLKDRDCDEPHLQALKKNTRRCLHSFLQKKMNVCSLHTKLDGKKPLGYYVQKKQTMNQIS